MLYLGMDIKGKTEKGDKMNIIYNKNVTLSIYKTSRFFYYFGFRVYYVRFGFISLIVNFLKIGGYYENI